MAGLTEAGAGIGGVIGALIGEAMARGDYAEAERLQKLAAGGFDGIQQPGELERVGATELEGAAGRLDPESRQTRLAALRRIMQMGQEGGMDAESRAALAAAQQQASQYEASQRGALMQGAQARGLGNSNMAMGAQLQAQQSGADRLSQAGVQAAGDARARALRALASGGDMAGGIQRDDYAMERDRAMSQDAIARFNAQNANQYQQNRFKNQMELQQAKYGAQKDLADMYDEKGNKKVRKARGYGEAIGGAAGAGGDAYLKGGF